ncbi:MAG: HPr family phosphocarrier protein [Lachnospiraceae bacterium]|nr:HPr family phosphocarrier protein [Lachnospiraceae bacterium]
MVVKAVEVSMKEEDKDARPIAELVQMASMFDSSVYIDCDSKHVNVKSIMGMMTLSLKKGDQVNVVADGSDEQVAVENISSYLLGRDEVIA